MQEKEKRNIFPFSPLHSERRRRHLTRLVLSGQMPSPSLGVQRREREYIPLFLLLHQLKCMGSSLRLYMYSCLVISHCEIMVKQLGMHITLKLEFSGILGDSWMRSTREKLMIHSDLSQNSHHAIT